MPIPESIQNNRLSPSVVIRTFPIPEGDDVFAGILQKKHLEIVEAPMIEVEPLPFSLQQASEQYDWLVFTSKNGIKTWFAQFGKAAHQKIAVLGPSSNETLAAFGLSADFTGSGHSGSAFAKEFQVVLQGREQILLVLGRLAPNVVQKTLMKNWPKGGAPILHRVDVYETRMPATINCAAIDRINGDDYRVIAVSSPSAVHNLMTLLDHRATRLRFASIGSITSKALRTYGIKPVAEAHEQSYKGLANIC
jgi:uroporphyrinogen-III synthase